MGFDQVAVDLSRDGPPSSHRSHPTDSHAKKAESHLPYLFGRRPTGHGIHAWHPDFLAHSASWYRTGPARLGVRERECTGASLAYRMPNGQKI